MKVTPLLFSGCEKRSCIDLGHRAQGMRLECREHHTSLAIVPGPRGMTLLHAQNGLWPISRGSISVVDAQVIEVSRYHDGFSNWIGDYRAELESVNGQPIGHL